MKVTICRLYKDGRPDNDISEEIAGDLNYSHCYYELLSRTANELQLITSIDGRHSIAAPTLFDAFCYSISAHGMRWRGFELTEDGRQVAQEWYVMPTK